MLETQRYNICGIEMDALRYSEFIDLIGSARSNGDRLLILNHNLHSLYLYEWDPTFAETYRHATHAYIDGMPVVWLGRLAGHPLDATHRITFLDCFDRILNEAEQRGWRVYYLGSTPAVNRNGLEALRQSHPNLVLEGRSGHFDRTGPDNARVLAEIADFRPDILFVGMGMPIQEFWVTQNRAKLHAHAVLTCGATLDYVAGFAYRPPAWAGPLGLYGVFRLFSDPGRLWSRYLIEPLFVAWRLLPRLLLQRKAARSICS